MIDGFKWLAVEFVVCALQECSYGCSSILLDGIHVEMDGSYPSFIDQRLHKVCAFSVSPDLGFEIVEVVIKGPCAAATWIGTCFFNQDLGDGFFVENAIANEEHGCYLRAFFVEFGAAGGHRSREDAADFGMVAPRCGIEDYVFVRGVENWCYDSDIGQVGASGERSGPVSS